jgi:hypothetical protein
VGGEVGYVDSRTDALTLFAGRPFVWRADGLADGVAPLRAGFFSAPSREWVDRLDGRCAVARYEDDQGVLEVYSDPLGSYPLYLGAHAGTRWISNNPCAVAAAIGSRTLDAEVLAEHLGGGWPLDGDPWWSGVRRLDPTSLHSFGGAQGESLRTLLAPAEIAEMYGAGADLDEAASLLVQALDGLTGWPGRPDVIGLSGGRDSRLILAAALHTKARFRAQTGGSPDSPDYRVAERLCEITRMPHEPSPIERGALLWADPARAARTVALQAAGTATIADGAGLRFDRGEGILPLYHTGQGGEISRRSYDHAAAPTAALTGRLLYRHFVGQRPGRGGVLTESARRNVQLRITAWAHEQLEAGVRVGDLPDAFYLGRRMGTWAGGPQGCYEYFRDVTSPLWCRPLLRHQLGLTTAERAANRFHRGIIERLAPELLDVPFHDGTGWPPVRRAAARRARRALQLAHKAQAEIQRRRKQAVVHGATPSDHPTSPKPSPQAERPEAGPTLAPHALSGTQAGTQALTRQVAMDTPSHPAWDVLDRERVGALLSADPASLDPMSEIYVWRLAGVFLAELQAPPW